MLVLTTVHDGRVSSVPGPGYSITNAVVILTSDHGGLPNSGQWVGELVA